MAENEKICKSLHLPFQAGNNRILKEMNRKYTREDYLALVGKIKFRIPGIALTSDVIVGFPNETDREFSDTLSVVEQVRFDSLFTFIYSKRKDTAAAKMPDGRTYPEKLANFNKLLELQTRIGKEINDTYLENVYEIMDEGISKNNPGTRSGRTGTNKIINYAPKSGVNEGDFIKVKVTEVKSWSLNGVEV
jgi:tRNA-2-methylthio-N6-dimethylallyladenosine synthase